MPKLTIIVNCTDRKSLAPAPNLRIGSLPKGDNETRFEAWRQRVESAQPQVQLLDLYQGEAWQQVRGLANDAAKRRLHRPDAGRIGRSRAYATCRAEASAYAATFAGGHADSVASGRAASATGGGDSARSNQTKSLAGDAGIASCSSCLRRMPAAWTTTWSDSRTAAETSCSSAALATIDGLPRLPADRIAARQLWAAPRRASASEWPDGGCNGGLERASTAPHDTRAWSRWARSVCASRRRYDRPR